MKHLPRVVGLLAAILAAAVLPPSAAAVPAGPLEDATDDPLGFLFGLVGEPVEESPVPLPEPLASNPLVNSGLCYRSSDTPGFCTPPLVADDGLPAGANVSAEEPDPAPDPAAAPIEQGPKEEPALAQPPHEVADSGAPGPREPENDVETPPVESTDPVAPAPADVGGLNWAVLAAAIALPWAVGLKVLATLLGMRRASRLGRGDAGRPTLRDAVLQAVASEPGIRHSDLVARIGRGNGTVEHHVRTLLAEGRLARRRGLGSTIYFPAGALGDGEARMLLALQGRTSRRMARAIAERPGIRLGELARELGISGATAHYQAGKLARAGIVREEGGAGRRLAVTAEAASCLAGLASEPPQPVPPQRRTLIPQATPA